MFLKGLSVLLEIIVPECSVILWAGPRAFWGKESREARRSLESVCSGLICCHVFFSCDTWRNKHASVIDSWNRVGQIRRKVYVETVSRLYCRNCLFSVCASSHFRPLQTCRLLSHLFMIRRVLFCLFMILMPLISTKFKIHANLSFPIRSCVLPP